jgi:hypothetical protein
VSENWRQVEAEDSLTLEASSNNGKQEWGTSGDDGETNMYYVYLNRALHVQPHATDYRGLNLYWYSFINKAT